MPKVEPTGAPFGINRIVYSRKSKSDLGAYTVLQRLSKFGEAPDWQIREYEGRRHILVANLASQVTGTFDAIVTPPSSHNRSEPYKLGLAHKATVDLSGRFSKKPGVHAKSSNSFAEYFPGTSYAAQGDESRFSSLLIVDEIIATGRSVRAVIEHLRAAGLPATCEITVATPIWLSGDDFLDLTEPTTPSPADASR